MARSGGLVGLVLRLVWLAFRLGRLGRQAGPALVLRLGWHIFIECEVGLAKPGGWAGLVRRLDLFSLQTGLANYGG